MNSLFCAGEPVGGAVVEPGEAPAERLPERAPPVARERRQELGEHGLAEAVAVHREVEEADLGELLARVVGAAARASRSTTSPPISVGPSKW